jgi:hypothetical protein
VALPTHTPYDWQNYPSRATPINATNLEAMDTALGQHATATGEAVKAEQRKALAADIDGIIAGAIVRDSNGAALSAGVVWPDGQTGTYTATTVSTLFPGAVDAYTVTYVPVSGPTLTYTQPTVTRDASTGAVVTRPAITVA